MLLQSRHQLLLLGALVTPSALAARDQRVPRGALRDGAAEQVGRDARELVSVVCEAADERSTWR